MARARSTSQLRRAVAGVIESLIDILDAIDRDPDLEIEEDMSADDLGEEAELVLNHFELPVHRLRG